MKSPSKRILVTGASGFLGRAVCRALIEERQTVLGTVRNNPAVAGTEALSWPLEAPAQAAKLLDQSCPDHVIHLASPIDLSRSPTLIKPMNRCIVEAGQSLALACEARGIPLLVAGTCEEYGAVEGPYVETMAAPGVSPYSKAKAELSEWLMQRHALGNLRVTVVRPFLTYGPGQHSNRLIPAAIQAALNHASFDSTLGEQTREFNYVSDMVRALLAATCSECEGEILNLGGGPERRIRDVITDIYRLVGADIELVNWGALDYRKGEVKRFVGDHTKSQHLLKIHPQVGLEDGLRATIAWWRQRAASEN